jgi:hypothetical protein
MRIMVQVLYLKPQAGANRLRFFDLIAMEC